jgi:chromate transporter
MIRTGEVRSGAVADEQRVPPREHGVPFSEAVRTWARVAALSFGGPAGQIAVMHRILVEEKRWIGEARFLHALNYCMLLPGPEAQQLAVYVGWLLHRVPGGLVAGTLFVLPGFLAIMALSLVYATLGDVGLVRGLFFGLKAAVLAIVIEAVVRIGKRALKSRAMLALAAAAFIAIFAFDVPFPLIILGAGVIGYMAARAGLPQSPAAADMAARGLCSTTPSLRSARPCPPTPVRGLPGPCGWRASASPCGWGRCSSCS